MIEVVAAVIRDQQGRILITRRPQHVHQGGLWEFPGGKREAEETAWQALSRELKEEVDIDVVEAVPLIKIDHDYGDKHVLLDVWNVSAFKGEAWGREGQEWRWIDENTLNDYAFPAANQPIIKALRLPAFYAVLEGDSQEQVWQRYQHLQAQGIYFLQIRLKNLDAVQRQQVLKRLQAETALKQCWLINSDIADASFPAAGLHLTAQALCALSERPQGYQWVAASCHSLLELQHAERLNLDFAVLSPVQITTTHPHAQVLGWDVIEPLLRTVRIPVYLMGGLKREDLSKARERGAQGLAGITTFLDQ